MPRVPTTVAKQFLQNLEKLPASSAVGRLKGKTVIPGSAQKVTNVKSAGEDWRYLQFEDDTVHQLTREDLHNLSRARGHMDYREVYQKTPIPMQQQMRKAKIESRARTPEVTFATKKEAEKKISQLLQSTKKYAVNPEYTITKTKQGYTVIPKYMDEKEIGQKITEMSKQLIKQAEERGTIPDYYMVTLDGRQTLVEGSFMSKVFKLFETVSIEDFIWGAFKGPVMEGEGNSD